MLDFSILLQNKNGNCDDERKESMKDYIDYTLDTTKKGHQNIEHKTLFNKDENQSNIKTIEPDFNYITKDSSEKKSPQKEIQKHKISIQPKIGKNNSFDFQNLCKLRPQFFKLEDYLNPFNIKIIDCDSIILKQVIQKIDIGINKYEEILNNEKSMSELAKIFEIINYLKEIKREINSIIQNINIFYEENTLNTDFEKNKKDNINNNILDCVNNETISSIISNQDASKKNNDTFLGKKRNLIEDNTELKKQEKILYKTASNNANINIKKVGRLSNELRNKGIKGIKDGSHPDNGVIKIMRHSLNNICSIFITILQIIDANTFIFLPGINDKDLKNTTTKQTYLGKTIEEILCIYISIETKKDKIEENRNKIDDLLKEDILGKVIEQNLLKKILKMKLKEVCYNYINNIKDFIDGYTFKTFEDDEDFRKYDDSKVEKILKQAEDLINNKIRKRPKTPQ